MSKITVIRKGSSLPFVFDRNGEDTDGYVCTIFVKQFPADVATITRVIALDSDGLSWSGFLTSTETDTLDVGLWVINATLVKSSTDEEEAVPVRFQISENWA